MDTEYGPGTEKYPKEEICHDFFVNLLEARLLNESITYFLSIFNVILRYLVIFVIMQIGYETETAQLRAITLVTFLCQFFNTAFVLLLVNADMTEQPFPTMGFNSG